MNCDQCGSKRVAVREYQYATESETGYQDAGEVLVCLECGNKELL